LLLNQVTQRYSTTNFYVTDVAMVTEDDGVGDRERVEMIRSIANEVLKGL